MKTKWLIGECTFTYLLDKYRFEVLLSRWKEDGFSVSTLEKDGWVTSQNFLFVGINRFGDALAYNDPTSYLGVSQDEKLDESKVIFRNELDQYLDKK